MHPWRRPGLQLHGVLNGQNPTSFNKNGRRGSHLGNVRGDSSDDFLVADLRELMSNVYRVRSFSRLRNLSLLHNMEQMMTPFRYSSHFMSHFIKLI